MALSIIMFNISLGTFERCNLPQSRKCLKRTSKWRKNLWIHQKKHNVIKTISTVYEGKLNIKRHQPLLWGLQESSVAHCLKPSTLLFKLFMSANAVLQYTGVEVALKHEPTTSQLNSDTAQLGLNFVYHKMALCMFTFCAFCDQCPPSKVVKHFVLLIFPQGQLCYHCNQLSSFPEWTLGW